MRGNAAKTETDTTVKGKGTMTPEQLLAQRHPMYKWFIPFWRRCRHLYQGEDAIKNHAEQYHYLPRPEGMEDWAYYEYNIRATLPGIFESTVNGRLGDIFRKSPIATGSDELLAWIENVTSHEEGVDILANRVLRELMVTGRCALVLDFDTESERFLVHLYKAEDVINWNSSSENRSVLLQEVNYDPDHPLGVNKEQYLRLFMEDGICRAIRYEKGSDGLVTMEESTPTMGGRPLDFLPVVVVNSERLGFECNEPPMLNLSNLLLSYYRNSADYEQGLHAIGVPTPYITGIREPEAAFSLGPYTPIVLEPADAKVGFLEFSGAGMTHLKEAMDEKLVQAVMMGARLLQPRRQVESAESARTRMGAETSILNSLVRVTEVAIERLMEQWHRWKGIDPDGQDFSYELNRDFIEEQLDPNVLKVINESEMQGLISPQTAFNLRKKLEVYPDGLTFEEERDNINQLGSNVFQTTPSPVLTSGNVE